MYSGEAVETGPIAEVFDEMRHPYTQGLFRSIPLPGADKTRRPLIAIPGNFPLPHERPPGCNFGPRCGYFVKGRCDARDIPMEPVSPEPRHPLHPLGRDRLGGAPARDAPAPPPPPLGDVVLARRRAEEILPGRLERALRRRHPRGQGQRGRQLRGARGRDAGHRRRERLRQVDARQGAARPRDRHRGHGLRSATSRSATARSSGATPAPSPRSRWCSRTPSTR